jgi:hypothetical protein
MKRTERGMERATTLVRPTMGECSSHVSFQHAAWSRDEQTAPPLCGATRTDSPTLMWGDMCLVLRRQGSKEDCGG